MTQQYHERLHLCVNSQMLTPKAQGANGGEHGCRRQLAQQILRETPHETIVAAFDWMTDLIAFRGVEEEDLVRIGNRLPSAHMANVHATVRKDQVCDGGAFLGAPMSAGAGAAHVQDRHRWRRQQTFDFALNHPCIIALVGGYRLTLGSSR